MSQLAIHNSKMSSHEQQANWLAGRIVNLDEGTLYVNVQSERRVYTANKAFSCLMEPLVGDLVGMFRDENKDLYVTSILQRQTSQPESGSKATLQFAGHLSIKATQGLSLHTQESLEIEAGRLHGVVSRVNWFSKIVQLTSRDVLVTSSLARMTCRIRELLTGRSHVSADHSYRHIQKTETVRTEVYDLEARSLASVQAPCTLIKGKNLVKVDSSQVHIG